MDPPKVKHSQYKPGEGGTSQQDDGKPPTNKEPGDNLQAMRSMEDGLEAEPDDVMLKSFRNVGKRRLIQRHFYNNKFLKIFSFCLCGSIFVQNS